MESIHLHLQCPKHNFLINIWSHVFCVGAVKLTRSWAPRDVRRLSFLSLTESALYIVDILWADVLLCMQLYDGRPMHCCVKARVKLEWFNACRSSRRPSVAKAPPRLRPGALAFYMAVQRFKWFLHVSLWTQIKRSKYAISLNFIICFAVRTNYFPSAELQSYKIMLRKGLKFTFWKYTV